MNGICQDKGNKKLYISSVPCSSGCFLEGTGEWFW